jgi:hypothetical protein
MTDAQKEQTKMLINKVWRVQSKVVGDAAITELYDAIQAQKSLDELLSSTEGGSSFDLHGTWQLLYEAVDFTVNVLALYGLWRQRHGHESPPSKKDILLLLREAKLENYYSYAVLDRLDALIEQIEKQGKQQ